MRGTMRKTGFFALTLALCLGQQCAQVTSPPPVDTPGATHVGNTIPNTLVPGEIASVEITFENTGNTTWSSANGYKLAAVDESDPFAACWQELEDSDTVAPGQQKSFAFEFTAPAEVGTYISDWQMWREGAGFGGTLNKTIRVIPPAPAVTQHPSAATVYAGETATFTVACSGMSLVYQWQKNGTDLTEGGHYSGVDTATLTISDVSLDDAASYRCTVINSSGNATSTAAALTVWIATSITQQPQAQTVCAGAAVSFTVTAVGESTISYQWQKNGTNIAGATGSTLQISSATPGDAANYRCIVTGLRGTVTSEAAGLTVNDLTMIAQSPSTQNVCAGSSASFSVSATGSGLSYQWKKDGVDITDSGNISGATGATLHIAPATLADSAAYHCVVTGVCGTANSDIAGLTIKPSLAFTQQPEAVLAGLGENASFSVAVSGEAPFTYQWRKGGVDLTDGGSISGAQTDTLQITGVASGDYASYACAVTDGCAVTLVSDAATLGPKPAPIIAGPATVDVAVEKNSTCAATANNVALSATDADTAPENLSWSIKTAPTLGAASFVGGVSTGANVTVCYTPNADQLGADTFVVEVADGTGGTDEVTIDVTICSMIDDFNGYADQAAFEAVWHDTNNSTYYFDAASGNPAGCLILPSPAANYQGRYHRNIGFEADGTDANPLTLTFDFWLDPAVSPGWGGARHFVEMRAYAGAGYADGALQGGVVIGLNNSSSDAFSTLRYQARVINGSNWLTLDEEAGAPNRSSGWHTMKIEVTTGQVKFYVDEILCEIEARHGTYTFDCLILGSDLTAGGWTVRIDNVHLTYAP